MCIRDRKTTNNILLRCWCKFCENNLPSKEDVRTHKKKPFNKENQFKPSPSMQTLCHASNSNKQNVTLKHEDTLKRNFAVCSQDHSTFTCKQLINLIYSLRFAKAKQHNLCINCLQNRHKTIKYKSLFNFKYCNKCHHSVLYTDSQAINEPKATGERATDVKNTISMYSSSSEEVILVIAIILITYTQGATYPCVSSWTCLLYTSRCV